MKNLAHPSFFRLFDLLSGITNPGLKLSAWLHDGASWKRERHAFAGPKYGITIDVMTLTRPGKQGWSLMIVKEYWWAGSESGAIKSLRWAKPLHGQRRDIMSWFRAQELSLDRRLVPHRTPIAAEVGATDEIELLAEDSDE